MARWLRDKVLRPAHLGRKTGSPAHNDQVHLEHQYVVIQKAEIRVGPGT